MCRGNASLDGVYAKKYFAQARRLGRIFKCLYNRVQTERDIFLARIKGISSQANRSRYASLMLTRLMFLYFIQHKAFLDNDTNYLLNHLKMTQNRKGIGLNFYRDFLLILFH